MEHYRACRYRMPGAMWDVDVDSRGELPGETRVRRVTDTQSGGYD